MASYDVLREIVSSGCDLTLCDGISYEVLDELAASAQQSGAHLTITTSISYEVIRNLVRKYGKTISFIDGLNAFEKK
jgi:hypothetical protein